MGEEKKDRNSPRAAAEEPIDYVMDQLYDLKVRLEKPCVGGDGALQAYDYFCRVSDKGRQCTYGIKSKHLFLTRDWGEVKQMLAKLIELVRQVPGESEFGKK